MSKFVSALEFDKLEDGGLHRIEIEDYEIVIVRVGDKIHALEDQCTHEEFPLSEGWVENGELCCAFHGARFDVESGDPLSLPAYEAVKTFPVRINNGMIEVDIED